MSKSKTEEQFFAFHAYRNDLARILDKFNHVIEDLTDFWRFVFKYEEVERKKQDLKHVGQLSKPKLKGTLSISNKNLVVVNYRNSF